MIHRETAQGGRQRARITIPDVLFLLMTLAFVAALWPVFADFLTANSGELGQGEMMLYTMILPLGLLVVFTIIYQKAIRGVRF